MLDPLLNRPRPPYRGSALLYSGARRVLWVLPCVAGLWVLAGWALAWW